MLARPGRRFALVALVALSVSVPSCNSNGTSSSEDVSYTFEHLQSRAASRNSYYESVADLLPNVTYRLPSGEPTRVVSAVVVGRIVDVAPGRGYDEAADGQRRVDFDDGSADWRTLHLSIDVTETIGQETLPDQISVGLAIGGGADVGKVERGLEDLGTVLVFLDQGSAVFSYDPNLYNIVEDGALLATLDDQDVIRFPAKDVEAAAAFQGGIRTLADLHEAAAAPGREIQLSDEQGVVTRD